MTYNHQGCWHLAPLMDPERRESNLRHAKLTLQGWAEDFDTIVVTGMSGALFGAPLAYILNKPLLVVRKELDTTTHGAQRLEGNHGLERYLFVDDMVASGDTLRYVVYGISAKLPNAKLMGIYTQDTGRVEDAMDIYSRYKLALSDVVPARLPSSVAGEKLADSLGELARGL